MMSVTWNSNIQQFLRALDTEINTELKMAAEKIYTNSQANCPVDTGKLKASGYTHINRFNAQVGYTAEYAALIDFNTGFFRNALVLNEQHIISGFIEAINRAKGV